MDFPLQISEINLPAGLFFAILRRMTATKGAIMSKFLTFEERLAIARGLTEQLSFGEIGKELSKDRSTIAKEVKRYAVDIKGGCSYYAYNSCVHRAACREKKVCGEGCTRPSATKCSVCNKCNDHCKDFQEEICTGRFKPPYVCNGCQNKNNCTLKKFVYDPEEAHAAFLNHLSSSRSGICSTEADLARINEIITPLVRNGLSLHQIYSTHADELMCSEKTLYNYVDACLFDVRNIDLPRKVKYRPRYKKPEFKVDRACRNGRNYQEFQKFMASNPELQPVQMDSVIGSIGGKVLLTIHFVETSLMLAFLRDANTSRSVTDIWEQLNDTLGTKGFKELFPVILTDNGSEFSNPAAIENGRSNGQKNRTRIFYCDPSCPYQKGAIEVNHELIRRILPKGTSFDSLTQNDINRMMDHINSYTRKKLNNRTPYESFSFFYGEMVLKKLGCHQVPASDIILKPSLLKK